MKKSCSTVSNYDALINAGYEDQLTELGILSANDTEDKMDKLQLMKLLMKLMEFNH